MVFAGEQLVAKMSIKYIGLTFFVPPEKGNMGRERGKNIYR